MAFFFDFDWRLVGLVQSGYFPMGTCCFVSGLYWEPEFDQQSVPSFHNIMFCFPRGLLKLLKTFIFPAFRQINKTKRLPTIVWNENAELCGAI
jgi:hypothetical protein